MGTTWDKFRSLFGSGAAVAPSPSYALASPWEGSNPAQLVWAEHFATAEDIVSRVTALQVPAIARARGLLVGAISDLPLVAYTGETRVAKQPTWLYRTNGPLSPWHRMAATIDDHLHYGVSLWARQNGADGFPIDYIRVPRSRWEVNSFGEVLVDGKPAPANEVTVIPGPGEGILTTGAGTIRGARAIENAWQARVKTPIPPTLFEQVEKEASTPAEVQTLLTGWAAQRRSPDASGVGFVPFGLKAVFPAPNDDSSLFIEGRNAIRLDVGNLTNIPASLLDGSMATASLTYVTQEGQRSSFHEQTLRYWTAPIEHRLSMDDVVPRGQRVRFDISYTTQQPPTGEPSED